MPKLSQIIEADNIAELEDIDLSYIAGVVNDGYMYDDESRSQQKRLWREIDELLKVDLNRKSYPFDGASNIKMPVLLNACITFAARALPAMIRDGNIVKAKAIGDDSGKFFVAPGMPEPQMVEAPGSKQSRADRVSEYMNWQILYNMDNWEEDFDDMLNKLPAFGSMFKKIYHSPADDKKHSELIYPHYLCVNIEAESIEKAPRVSHEFYLTKHEIMQKIHEGVFIDFRFEDEDVEKSQKFIEQHTRMDLDGDGYPEPYIITLHCDTEQVVSIYKRFDEDNIFYKEDDEDEVSYIEAQQYFVHYKFMPEPQGSFYGMGYGHLILTPNNALNSLTNQIIDAGHMSLIGGFSGFIGRGMRMRGGPLRMPMGTYQVVNASGAELKNNIVNLPTTPPSGTTLSLAGELLSYMRNVTGMRDVLEGQIRSDQTATATLAQIDNSLNEFKSIFKRIYRSMKREFEYLYRLNARFPDAEEYQEVLDMPDVNIANDINLGTYDIYPVADMTGITNIQQSIKSEILMQMAQANMIAPKPAIENRLKSLGIADYQQYMEFEPTSQEQQLQMQLAQAQQAEAQAKIEKTRLDMMKLEVDAFKAQASVNKDNSQAVKNIADADINIDRYRGELEQLTQLSTEQMNEQRTTSGDTGTNQGLATEPS